MNPHLDKAFRHPPSGRERKAHHPPSLVGMSDPTPPFLRIVDHGAVRWLTLNNPQRRNALPRNGYQLLADAFDVFEGSDQRALVLTGAGGHFCAGADLAEAPTAGDGAAENLKAMKVVSGAATALHRLSKPTLAAVDGVAVGAGMNLALGCDIVIATEAAIFAELFVRRGLTLDFGGSWVLPRLVGLARARELALTGREVGAAEALAMGLISRVVPAGKLETEAGETAEALAAGAPLAQEFVKRGLDRASSMTFEQAVRFEDQAQAVLLSSEDFIEGVEAFFAKRPPRFQGR